VVSASQVLHQRIQGRDPMPPPSASRQHLGLGANRNGEACYLRESTARRKIVTPSDTAVRDKPSSTRSGNVD